MPELFYYDLLKGEEEEKILVPYQENNDNNTTSTTTASTGSMGFTLEVIIGIGAGGGALLLCFLFCLCVCCVCICCWIRRKKRHSTNIIQNFPKFRVLDAPNPNFREDAVSSSQYRDDIPLTVSTSTTPSTATPNHNPARPNRHTISDYSYANPDEFRIMTAAGVRSPGREGQAEEYMYARNVEVKSKTHSLPHEFSRAPAAYSEPNEIIGKYGSVATTPPLSPIASPQRKEFCESSPPLCESHYMTPATDEESLYAQIKSLSVQHLSKTDITTQEALGTGNFGVVLKGLWNTASGPEPVAVKTLKINTTSNIIKFLQEAAIMGQFHHPNIIKLHGVVTTGEPVMIVLELMDLGDLKNYLNGIRMKNLCSDPKLPGLLLSFCRQIASGMEYLSKKGFVHRDLAARNIFLKEDLNCKIGDFGLARDLMDEDYYIATGGKIPIKWTAPEALSYKKYSSASDVWSYGVLVYEIWSLGRKPFNSKTNQETLRLVEGGYRLPPPPGCPRSIYELMISCWNPEASRRPSFEALHSLLLGDEMMLLQWSDRDKGAHPDVMLLGADFDVSQGLYTDLQLAYNMS